MPDIVIKIRADRKGAENWTRDLQVINESELEARLFQSEDFVIPPQHLPYTF